MTMPAAKPWAWVRKATAGVVMTPAFSTVAPPAVRPAVRVAAIQSEDSRVSMPMRTRGLGVACRVSARGRGRWRRRWRGRAGTGRRRRGCRRCRRASSLGLRGRWGSGHRDQGGIRLVPRRVGEDGGAQTAIGEAGADELAGAGVGGVAQDGAVRRVDEGVAAVEDGEGREGFEAERWRWRGGSAGWAMRSRGDAAEAIGGDGEAALRSGEADGGVLTAEAGGRAGSSRAVRLRRRRPVADSRRWCEVVDALLAAEDGVAEAGEDVAGGEAGEALAGVQEMEAGRRGGRGARGSRRALRCGAARR